MPLSDENKSSERGLRPTATISLSNNSVCSPPALVYVTSTLPFLTSVPITRAPRRISSPCFLKILPASLAICTSIIGKNSSSASNMTTSDPRRRQTLPSSKPMTPAPITPRRTGTSVSMSAPVESIICSSSIGAGAILTGTEPAAIMTLLASNTWTLPLLSVTSTFAPTRTFPTPEMGVTPLCLKSPVMPPVSCETI